MRIRSLFLYPDEQVTASRAIARNVYLVLGWTFYWLLLLGNVLAGALMETAPHNAPWWMPYYIYLVYLPVVVLYWTPMFQRRVLGPVSTLQQRVMYVLVLVPVFGSLALLALLIPRIASEKLPA